MRVRGQTSTEYMLVISVIVIAVTAGAYLFVQPFQEGVTELASDVSSILSTGQIGGIGLARNGAAGGAGASSGTQPSGTSNPGQMASNNNPNPNPWTIGAPPPVPSTGNGQSRSNPSNPNPPAPSNPGTHPVPGNVAFSRQATPMGVVTSP